MIPVLTDKAAYALDSDTIESSHLEANELMSNAGCQTAQFILEEVKDPFNQIFNVIAGPGNNGADAIISHFFLTEYGAHSKLFLFEYNELAENLLKEYKISGSEIQLISEITNLNHNEWYIDGIFGIGLSRNIKGTYSSIRKTKFTGTSYYIIFG